MPFKRKEGKTERSNLDVSLIKFRRIKTLTKKMVSLAQTCNLQLNMFVFDPKFVKITEYYTDPRVKLETITQEIEKAKTGPKKTKKNKVLQVKSIDAT